MTPESPRPALTPKREKELLGLIEAYWRIKSPIMKLGRKTLRGVVQVVAIGAIDGRDYPITDDDMGASWAESEACLREVAGECAVRSVNVSFDGKDYENDERVFLETIDEALGGNCDPSRPVALLKAFCAAFGSEPRHE